MKPSISHMATAIFITLRLSLRAPDRARRLETVVLIQSKVDPRWKKQPRFKFWRFLVLFMVAPHRRFAACPSRIVKFVKILPSREVVSRLSEIKKIMHFLLLRSLFNKVIIKIRWSSFSLLLSSLGVLKKVNKKRPTFFFFPFREPTRSPARHPWPLRCGLLDVAPRQTPEEGPYERGGSSLQRGRRRRRHRRV